MYHICNELLQHIKIENSLYCILNCLGPCYFERSLLRSPRLHLFKAAVRNFFLVKNDPKSIFEQVHNQPVFKTIALL